MATLRDTIQAEIVVLEADLTKKKQELADMETIAADWLGQEVDRIKAFFRFDAIKSHLGL